MRSLDLWLEHIDTEQTLPLFEQETEEYTVGSLKDVNWDSEPPFIAEIVRCENFSVFMRFESPEPFSEVFLWLLEKGQSQLLLRSFDYLLSAMSKRSLDKVSPAALMPTMLEILRSAPYLALSFGKMEPVEVVDEYSENLQTLLEVYAMDILRAYVLSANEAQDLLVKPLQSFLSRIRYLSFDNFADLAELVSLTVRRPEIATDVLLECLERESPRLLAGRPALVRHFVRNTIAIALDHIGEASEQSKKRQDLLKLKLCPENRGGYQVVEITFRIDSAGGTPENSAHVRLTAAAPPANSLLGKRYSMDALVIHSEQGRARFQCFHPLPPFYDRCAWKLEYCGPFTTTKTMFDAVREFATYFEGCCPIANQLLLGDVPALEVVSSDDGLDARRVVDTFPDTKHLNASQNAAVQAALNSPLTCLWGPPGTGKTETIVQIIRALQISFRDARILVTAPTHNAVDNVMRRYIGVLSPTVLANNRHLAPLRVSTEVRKVAEDLRKYTCDAMVGHEIYANRRALDQAKKQVRQSGIIFTTCIGAGLGLLRTEVFDIVIVDEASQQTEPASLVPLVKGCEKGILVGDHVQLRPTVHPHALPLEFDKSLFERLFTTRPGLVPADSNSYASPPFLARLMLDTQYRMHPSISTFASAEFYQGRLRAGIAAADRPLFRSAFPWPRRGSSKGRHHDEDGDPARMVFVHTPAREDLGAKSKTNRGQAALAAHICQLLCTPASAPATTTTATQPPREGEQAAPADQRPQSIAVLTPYARQVELLKRMLSSSSSSSKSKGATIEVSSIDGFQGREADVVVLVTVRSNATGEIGFLRDARRLNVALTRARAGVIVVGDRETLARGGSSSSSMSSSMSNGDVGGNGSSDSGSGGVDAEDVEGKGLWRRLLGGLAEVEIEMEEEVGAGPGSGV